MTEPRENQDMPEEAPSDVSGIQQFLTLYLYGAYFFKGGKLTQHEAINQVVAIAKVGDKAKATGKDVIRQLWGSGPKSSDSQKDNG
jgi:hypothetical protein